MMHSRRFGQSLFMLILGWSAVGTTATAARAADAPPAQNPVIWADVPDPSVIRVNDAYYMSSTTMHMCPGLPIMKSKDLVNWQLVGYAYDTLGDNDKLNLLNGQNAYGKGSWASSLRYHDGTFYVSTFSATTGKTHVYTTKDIEKGPWTARSFSPSLHDHSLVFDNGRVFMIAGAGDLRLIELEPDFSGLKAGGVNQVIIPNASAVAGPNIGLKAEGSQLFKVGNTYYLFNIVWPRGGTRTVICHRAKDLTGPWEGRVLLQDKGVAQGSLIDTPDGKWYGFLFRDFGAVGRIPYLVPVEWQDGWPVMGVNGQVPMALDVPGGGQGVSGASGLTASDDFDRHAGEPPLPLAWQWNHNPDNEHWSLTARPGFLRLTTLRTDATVESARNTLTQRTFGPTSSAVTSLDVSNLKPGDTAGLMALMETYGYVGVKATDGGKAIVMTRADKRKPVELAAVPLNQDRIYLKIDCDFVDRHDKAYFSYSLDGTDWKPIGEPVTLRYTLTHFMGCRFGLFNFASQSTGGFADFDFYHVGPGRTGPTAAAE